MNEVTNRDIDSAPDQRRRMAPFACCIVLKIQVK